MLTGDNGLLNKANQAKKNTEIAEEKEILNLAIIGTMKENRYGTITKKGLQSEVDSIKGINKVKIGEISEGLAALFIESNRYYEIDTDGNLSDYKVAESQDKNPGDITKDINGNILDGSVDKPYEINCIEDLVAFSNMTNGSGYMFENGEIVEISTKNTFSNKFVVLNRTLDFESFMSYMNSERTDFGDINGNTEDGNSLITEMTTGTGFRPINGFNGSFNGKNNEIQNIYENRESSAGVFIGSGTIKRIECLGVTGNITSTGSNAAGISCMSVSNIENCWNKANVTTQNASWTGGIVLYASYVKNSYNEGNIISESTLGCAGGIAAGVGMTIENCYNTGNVTGAYYVGGIISGHGNNITTAINCYNTGKITSQGGQVGGIIGTRGIAKNCYNTGIVSAGQYAGGIVGTRGVEIFNCYNTGDVLGVYTGGITYSLSNKIVNCYNEGSITGGKTGGIIGLNETEGTSISNSYNVGNVKYNHGNVCAGGIVGRNTKTIAINNCYNIGTVSGVLSYRFM